MAETIYALCGLTSMSCAGLLLRSYLRGRSRFLLWSSLCFAGIALNNLILFVDLVLLPESDFAVFRTLIAVVAVACLLYGLIWDTSGGDS